MKYKGKETTHHYTLTDTEKLALVGILSILDKKKELKITDKLSEDLVKTLLEGFNQE